MPYWLTFIAKPTGHLDTFLVPINERQMALGVATLLIDDAVYYYNLVRKLIRLPIIDRYRRIWEQINWGANY